MNHWLTIVFVVLWSVLGASLALVHLVNPPLARSIHASLYALKRSQRDANDLSDAKLRVIGILMFVMVAVALMRMFPG